MNSINFNGKTFSKSSLGQMIGKDMVALYNELAAKADVAPTKRFSSIGSGIERTWKLLQQVGKADATAPADTSKKAPAPVKTEPTGVKPDVEAKAKARSRGTNLAAPGHAPVPCREGSKQAILVDKLSSSKGATMADLLLALSGGKKPWTETSVRAGFGWDMKQKGYGVRSEVGKDGVERFFIVLPTGHAIPPHKPLAKA